MDEIDQMPGPALVPELAVTDIAASLRFWVDLCGFSIRYDRPEEGFAYLRRGGADVMLVQLGIDRDWVTGTLERPLGRGINFQITVPALAPILDALSAGGWSLFAAREERWYRKADGYVGQAQFLVLDPDGYLVRFAESLGERR
ncbi:bleomycin resistance protein [Rhodococcus qingshengii]